MAVGYFFGAIIMCYCRA